MTSPFWEWAAVVGGGFALRKEGRQVLVLDPAGVMRGLATPSGVVVGDLEGPFTGAVRFSSTAYIATLEFASGRVRVRSGDRISRLDIPGSGVRFIPAAGLTLPATGQPHRTARSGSSGVCVIESAAGCCVCAFDEPPAFDPDLAFAAFTATT